MTQSSTAPESVDLPADPPKVCANCRYMGASNGVNVCRRNPPNPEFPVVAVDDWCGEFAYTTAINNSRIQRLQFSTRLDELRRKREEDERIKPFHGRKSGVGDYVISGYRLICTCQACPEQYDVFDDETGVQVGYLRLRHGHFRADLRYCGGDCVYSADTIGDGVFDDKERMPQLKQAVKAIKKGLIRSVKEAKSNWTRSRD